MASVERELTQWRRSLADSRVFTPEDLAELETHVRDIVEDLERLGLAKQEALLVALRRVGDPTVLAPEFEKVNTSLAWARRLVWMAGGFLGFTCAVHVARAAAYGVASLGAGLGWEPSGVLILYVTATLGLWVSGLALLRNLASGSTTHVGVFLQRVAQWSRRRPFVALAGALTLVVGTTIVGEEGLFLVYSAADKNVTFFNAFAQQAMLIDYALVILAPLLLVTATQRFTTGRTRVSAHRPEAS